MEEDHQQIIRSSNSQGMLLTQLGNEGGSMFAAQASQGTGPNPHVRSAYGI